MNLTRITDSNKRFLLNYLRLDPIRHAFALFDIGPGFENSVFHMAEDDDKISGYLLTYRGGNLMHPGIILEGEVDAARRLLSLIPDEKAILFCPGELLPSVRAIARVSGVYQETLMAVRKGEERLVPNNPASRLTDDDARSVAILYSEMGNANRRVELGSIKRQLASTFFGVYEGGNLVSIAGTYVELPEVCVIGGVYTNPAHRGRGFAKMTTSAVLEHVLQSSPSATLYVRSDNRPAIKVYERLGFKEEGTRFFVDLGTGLSP